MQFYLRNNFDKIANNPSIQSNNIRTVYKYMPKNKI